MNCILFGHADVLNLNTDRLKKEILTLWQKYHDVEFLVGNNGSFDYACQNVLEETRREVQSLSYTIVLSHINEIPLNSRSESSIFPEELSTALPRFAISKRNNWMIKHADFAICYVSRIASNSYKIFNKLSRKGISVINLVDL